MNKIESAILEIEKLDVMAREDRWINQIHPLAKLFVTVLYIVLVMSFHRYDIYGLLSMAIYPFFIFQLSGLSFKNALYRLRVVLPLVCIVGIFNPIFDRTILVETPFVIRGGMVSMITLMLKGIFTVFATYILIASTTIEKICYALRKIHIPKILVTEIMLIYRYITVLLQETNRITQAYALRAPGQKGIAYKAWGSLAGQLLLRSMDRADQVYEAMLMRGYHGEFPFGVTKSFDKNDVMFCILGAGGSLLLRVFPLFYWIGSFFV
ncbi:MAG: cobalt ECF transporter T component CbiQ [Faecalicoccus sp.]|nr:cobalt ECF transporter T component CbiQ [Faecalicoccus sp.]